MSAPPNSPRAAGKGRDGGSRPLIERIVDPIGELAQAAPAGGVVLIVCAVIALVWANSPWANQYHDFWNIRISMGIGAVQPSLTLHEIVNDGLMAVFFFVVGLEIKREILVGELATMRRAALPVAAALGGMVVPALLFLAFNAKGAGARGWGVPMATDIAFALGVLALMGDRIPSSLRIFLSALAIADDLGAVLVIALFYTATISWTALAAAGVLLLMSLAANAIGVRATWTYAVIGIAVWIAVLLSGVHATVAGVLLALTIPSRTRIDEGAFLAGARDALSDFHDARAPESTVLSSRAHQFALQRLAILVDRAQAPLVRLEHGLHDIVTFGIMPVFALANAGVSLRGSGEALSSPVAFGVIAGLFLGKPIGISLASWAAVRSGIATVPRDVTPRMLFGAAWLGGIGFTMSLFIAGLAFGAASDQLAAAKLATFAGSMVAGIGGWLVLRGVGGSKSAEATTP
ncbi:MAG: Na+/H+ antiporter NhaA [Gemmatimonadota bacterium]|nr:Na+/H+ antiporter NhaA [Gemmatimonadota bacterium]